jgi:hypothetical protein
MLTCRVLFHIVCLERRLVSLSVPTHIGRTFMAARKTRDCIASPRSSSILDVRPGTGYGTASICLVTRSISLLAYYCDHCSLLGEGRYILHPVKSATPWADF